MFICGGGGGGGGEGSWFTHAQLFYNSHKSDLSQNCEISTTLIINLNKRSNSSDFPIEHSTYVSGLTLWYNNTHSCRRVESSNYMLAVVLNVVLTTDS